MDKVPVTTFSSFSTMFSKAKSRPNSGLPGEGLHRITELTFLTQQHYSQEVIFDQTSTCPPFTFVTVIRHRK